MFKLVVLSCLIASAFAGIIHAPASVAYEKTIVEPHVSVVETPTISHVGSVVKSFPSATSYQSQTQYHSKTYAEPIYAHGVEKKVISTPVVKQVVEHVPAVVPVSKVVSEPIYAKTVVAAPVHAAYHAAPVHAAYHAAPVHAEYHAAPVHAAYHAAPVHAAYSAPVYAQKAISYAPAYPAAYSAYSHGHHW